MFRQNPFVGNVLVQLLRTVRQLRPTNVGGFYQLFEVLMAFFRNRADLEAERCSGIRSSFTAKVLVQPLFNSYPDHALIPFLPVEDIWEAYAPFRLLPAARYTRSDRVRDQHSKI